MRRRSMTTCDCGEEMSRESICCKRCAYLDGVHPFQGRIIAALRQAGGRLLYQELERDLMCDKRQLWRTLVSMEKTGRCERRSVETDTWKEEMAVVLRCCK